MTSCRFLKSVSLLAALLVAVFLPALSACRSKDRDLSEEVEKLRNDVLSLKQLKYDVEKLQEDAAALKIQLGSSSVPAPQPAGGPGTSPVQQASFALDGSHKDDPFVGPKEAPVVMMVFAEFQCRPCRSFYRDTLRQIRNEFVDGGRLKLIFRDFPVGSHRHASRAAQLAHCAGEQGRYWEMFQILFENGEQLDQGDLDGLRKKLPKVNQDKLSRCAASGKYDEEIKRDTAEGKKAGASGAPALLIGRMSGNNRFEGVLIRGAQPYPVIRTEINRILENES